MNTTTEFFLFGVVAGFFIGAACALAYATHRIKSTMRELARDWGVIP